MQTTTLGRTNLTVSVMGLGCGGHSRLGLATGKTEADAIAIVKKARDLGVNFIDTAEAYGTETAVGKAVAGTAREAVVLSTKVGPRRNDTFSTRAQFKERTHACLSRLQTDYVDVLHLHGVSLNDYDYCTSELVPALQELRDEGKIRFLGITEAFAPDPQHKMLRQALKDDCWDVLMTGFNVLNQSARERVLPVTQAKGIGVLCMFAVRRALSRPDVLKDLLHDLVAKGDINANDLDVNDPLSVFGTNDPDVLTNLAYRFCRHEPGIDIVLSGTGNPAHLETNTASIDSSPLPTEITGKLISLFGHIDSVSGN